jgi:hypothetical protein
MGKLSKLSVFPKKLTGTQRVFYKLQTEMSTTLAPRLIGVFNDFGYESITIVAGGYSPSVTLKELTLISAPNNKYWESWRKPGVSSEIMHRDTLAIFDKLQKATEHLMKIRNKAERGTEWIERIGDASKRRVLIEKFKARGKKKDRV